MPYIKGAVCNMYSLKTFKISENYVKLKTFMDCVAEISTEVSVLCSNTVPENWSKGHALAIQTLILLLAARLIELTS